jgi:hypothetical protein
MQYEYFTKTCKCEHKKYWHPDGNTAIVRLPKGQGAFGINREFLSKTGWQKEFKTHQPVKEMYCFQSFREANGVLQKFDKGAKAIEENI